MNQPYQAVIAAPFGALGVRLERGQLTAIDFLPPQHPPLGPSDPLGREICAALKAYLDAPGSACKFPALPAGTAFQQRVWRALQDIPVGQTVSYGELAERVGSGARAVANACGANPLPILIPCHRVVAKNGLGGFMRGRASASLDLKQWLLDHERRKPASAG
jgi:methylated-DNA-[protein]-cysteine S-methyltransferase